MAKNTSEYKSAYGLSEQWCPKCRILLTRQDGYYECKKCNFWLDDSDIEDMGGYPTLESTNQYYEYYPTSVYDPNNDDDYEPWEL